MGHSRGGPARRSKSFITGLLAVFCLALPARAGDASDAEWRAISAEMREALASVAAEYAGPAGNGADVRPILVGLDGDWRRAAAAVLETAAGSAGVKRPLLVVSGYGKSGAAIGKFARELDRHGLEIALAVYIDAVSWRTPRVPANVRYAVSFYQRAGLFNGLPVRGKPRLAAERSDRTVLLGCYEITPRTGSPVWSWNLLRPIFYRHHHRMAYDRRLRGYLREVAAFTPAAHRAVAQPMQERGLFERVVILGASVSANERAPSPGLLLARHMGVAEELISVFAEGGAPSDRHLGFLDNIERLRPSLIVALDLFYHDFKASLFLTSGRKRYLRNYIARLHATGAVVVLGNLPGLVLLRHEHVNQYLDELAAEFPNLMVLDVRHLIGGLEPDGMLVRDGTRQVRLTRKDVFADRVHPNLLGSTVMANFILERLEQRYPGRLRSNGPLPLPIDKTLSHYAGQ